RTIGVDAAYAMKWAELIKLMTEVYCPRNEVQNMETKLWNLTVKGNDLTAYTQRFQELILLCTRMVPDEEDRVERFIGGLPDNIQGNVIAANPARFQDTIPRAYTARNNERKGYVRSLPYCSKCKLHHEGLCTIRCGNCKKVGHQTRDCRVTVNPNTQGAAVGNPHELEAILDRQDRVMRKKTIPFVKILWRNHPEREATWEIEELIRTSYPHFLP
nr:hypothetical protein [Tanacetum cinerariifolium]